MMVAMITRKIPMTPMMVSAVVMLYLKLLVFDDGVDGGVERVDGGVECVVDGVERVVVVVVVVVGNNVVVVGIVVV